ncbi:MAG: hypothetical protein FWB96_06505 [Defluviitaleaceae bacterium]|nr:hypothetical protein [Defluviitaleaceae bacterium]MCL2263821.1 hypothetical protein [Defluviitaleaceae bacterium]
MITKMKYISLSGHIAGLNHAVSRYLSRYDIQLEHSRHKLMEPFSTLNPYAQTFNKAMQLIEIVGLPPVLFVPMKSADAVNLVEEAAAAYEQRGSALRELEETLAQTRRQIEILENYTALNIDLNALSSLEFMHHRFGRFSTLNFQRFEKFLADDNRIFFITSKRDKDYIYGLFLTPTPHKDEIDAVFASLNFEVDEISPNGGDVFEMETEIARLTADALSGVCGADRLAIACAKVKNLYAAFDVKKYASISRGRRVFSFFGWIDEDAANALEAEIASDDMILFTRHSAEINAKPPTLLRNLPVIRQFEFFTRLYGLPEYGEIDPTPILAITYTLLFGLMFGDIGHGAVLAAIGIYIQKRRHANLGGIMTIAGISAAVFGVLYGSVFGWEFQPLWRRPTTNITETLLFATALGAGLIALSMLLNMYNSFKRGKIADLLFGANGFAGLIFYSAMLWLAFRLLVQGNALTPLVIFVAALPLVFVCFKHPLENFLAGRGIAPKNGIAAFIGSTAIELFETLLTYATNTISFVRVGAFAVSHAGMMHVVLQLSQGAAVTQNILILILGNALVILIEGLLVGIQVLRLDFYEIFSRFYKGTGKPFKSSNYNRIEG